LLNSCNGTILRPLAGSSFELVGPLVSAGSSALPLPEFAHRHGLAPKTLNNRISLGELGEEHGLQKRRGRWFMTDTVRLEQALG